MKLIDCPCNIYSLAKELCLHIDRAKRHCSIIIRKDRVISVGTNKMKTHPMAKKYGYLFDELHSELDAFRKCNERDGLELWNFRFNRFGNERLSCPCSKCLPWCFEVFDNIYYTTGTGISELSTDNLRSKILK
jgi:hypothetical protein